MFNRAIYEDNSKADRIRWIGAGFFVYDEEYHKKFEPVQNTIRYRLCLNFRTQDYF